MGDEHTGHIKKDKNKRARKKRFAEESSADSDSDDSRNSSIKSGKNGKHCQSNYVDYGSEDSADFSGSENSDVEDEEEEEEHEKFQFYEDRNGSKADYEIDIASGSDSPDTEPEEEEEEEEDDESDGDDDTNDNDGDDKAVLQLLNAKSLSKSISTLNNEEIQEIQNKEIDIGAKSKTPLSKSALKRLKKRNASGNITIKSEKSVSDDALAEANSSVALNDTKAEPVELNANDSIVKSESVETEEVELSKKNNVVRAAATQRKRRVIDDDDDSD